MFPPLQELVVEKGDRDQLQSRLTSQQKDLSSLERQLHETQSEVEKTRKLKKTAEDKVSELTRELRVWSVGVVLVLVIGFL